jgi:hypothetical protein
MRIVTDDGELSSTNYSGYGTNLSDDNWASPFSDDIQGNTYIGLCDNLSDSDIFSGEVLVEQGINDGEGLYTYNVSVDGFIENPLSNGVKQVSATGRFQTADSPIGFKLYTNDTDNVDFVAGVASITQNSPTGTLAASPLAVGLPEYGNMGTWYENTGSDNDMEFVIPAEHENRTDYPPLVDTAYMDGTCIDFFATANTSGSVTVKLGSGPVVAGKTPALDEIAADGIVEARPYTFRYSSANECFILTDLYIPDDFIETDMYQDASVTDEKIVGMDGSKLTAETVTTAKMASAALKRSVTGTVAYTSAGATFTLPHALGSAPDLYQVFFVNVTSDLNYSTGNTITLSTDIDEDSGSADGSVTIWADDTNIYVIVGTNGVRLLNKTTRVIGGASTASKWNFYARAWLLGG